MKWIWLFTGSQSSKPEHSALRQLPLVAWLTVLSSKRAVSKPLPLTCSTPSYLVEANELGNIWNKTSWPWHQGQSLSDKAKPAPHPRRRAYLLSGRECKICQAELQWSRLSPSLVLKALPPPPTMLARIPDSQWSLQGRGHTLCISSKVYVLKVQHPGCYWNGGTLGYRACWEVFRTLKVCLS